MIDLRKKKIADKEEELRLKEEEKRLKQEERALKRAQAEENARKRKEAKIRSTEQRKKEKQELKEAKRENKSLKREVKPWRGLITGTQCMSCHSSTNNKSLGCDNCFHWYCKTCCDAGVLKLHETICKGIDYTS